MKDSIQKILKTSKSAEQTESIGEDIGKRLRGGEIIVLSSDLGGGKTTLTRGIAKGAKTKDQVSSPSFTLKNTYQLPGGREIWHFDFYRVDDVGVVGLELHEAIGDDKITVIIEWPKNSQQLLPEDYINIEITTKKDESRELKLLIPAKYSYLIEGLR